MSMNDFINKIKENINKNMTNILLAVYFLFYVFWNNISLLITGDITVSMFLSLLINGINIPVLMIFSLILTGKYRTVQSEMNVELEIADKEKELALKQQQIEHLKELGDAYKTADELKKENEHIRELAEYQCQIAAIKGSVPNGVAANKEWNDANEALKE